MKENRCYLLNARLRKLVSPDFFHAGTYLGKARDGAFFPSLPLLAMMAMKESNRVTVNAKAEWLFICGRDIFKEGIVEVKGSKRKGAYTLVLNEQQECLGFGRIVKEPDKGRDKDQPTIRNILDIGDFLRREKPNLNARTRRRLEARKAERPWARKHYK
jgi:ribosome biogenesis protein Nip4